ncbi:MAG: hypothetical protein IJI36_17935 [Kiritimatiellae bacterium]|nr:hypothetical protein [Kiritimatiellia bacterium]
MNVRDNRITGEERRILAGLKGLRLLALVSTGSETASDEDVIIRTEDKDIRFHNTEQVPPSSICDCARAVIKTEPIGSFRTSWMTKEPKDAWDESYWSIVRIDKIVRKVLIYDNEELDSDCNGREFIDKDTALIVFVFDDSCLVLQHNLISVMWTMSYQIGTKVDFDKLFAIEGNLISEEL